jgi:group I intron endonuclease
MTNLIKHIKVLYTNAFLEKDRILSENKDKSGIYIWINNINNKFYIGSSKNLGDKGSGRLNRYYRPSYLINEEKSLIKDAIKKYGYGNFSVGILEYCTVDQLQFREQFYINLFKPEYNILLETFSSSGYKHTPEALDKMRGPRPNFKVSEENKLLLSQIHKKKFVSPETKNKIAEKISKPVYVYDSKLLFLHKYSGVVEAKKALHISTITIHKSAKTKKVYKNQYIFSFTPF